MSTFDYNLSTITQYRTGSDSDPYIDISEPKQVISGVAKLSEIPVYSNKVQVSGSYVEVLNLDRNELTSLQYVVDYSEGLVYFHSDADGSTLTFTYKGRGNHFISVSRVYTQETDGVVTQTLENLTDSASTATTNANTATSAANAAASSANSAASSANNIASSWSYKDAYNGSTSYVVNNTVTYNSETYICIQNSTGNLPTNTMYWRKIAASGSVVSVTSANSDVSITNTTINPVITLNSGSGANQIVKRNDSGSINIVNSDINASAGIDASKIANGLVSNTEFEYLDGVTSAIQTQIESKQDSITGGATTIISSNLTVNKALVSDASGKVGVSSTTSTELGYVSGVSSAIQIQLDEKQSTSEKGIANGYASLNASGKIPSNQLNISTTDVSEGNNLYYTESRVSANTDVAANTLIRTEVVNARTGADGTPHTTLKDRLDTMEAKQLAAATQSASLVHGWNYVLSDTDSPLNVRIKGVTRVNLLGKDGNCEDTSKWTDNASTHALDSANALYGSNAFKVTISGSTSGWITRNLTLDGTKYYLFAASFKNGNASTGIRIQFGGAPGATSYVTGTSYTTAYTKMQPSDAALVDSIWVLVNGADTQYAYVDGVRVYEISAADYAAIDTMTADQVAAKYPYCDSVQHLKNPILTVAGKNLLGASLDTLHANAVLSAPYELTLTATGSGQTNYINADVLPSKTYTVSVTLPSGGKMQVDEYDSSGAKIGLGTVDSTTSPASFTTKSTTSYVQLILYNSTATGTFIFSNWQLELGSTATDFVEASPKYMYVLTTLASNVDRTVYDTFDSQTNTVTRRLKTGVSLGGDLTWAFSSDGTGFKEVKWTGISGNTKIDINNPNGWIVKNDGKILVKSQIGVAPTNGDSFVIDSGAGAGVYLTISDTDSGWGEDYTPSVSEISAYFYGWKMNNGTFGTAYNGTGTKTWTPYGATDNSAAVTTVPTTLASGYPGYTLSYELAQSVTEAVQVEGALALVEGGNQVYLSEGIQDREKASPRLINGFYHINYNFDENPSNYLDNRAEIILKVFKGIDEDKKWTILANRSDAYGTARAFIAEADYDSTQEYYVTYEPLDKYSITANAVDADVEYATTDHSVLGQVVQKQSDIETDVTILQQNVSNLFSKLVVSATTPTSPATNDIWIDIN